MGLMVGDWGGGVLVLGLLAFKCRRRAEVGGISPSVRRGHSRSHPAHCSLKDRFRHHLMRKWLFAPLLQFYFVIICALGSYSPCESYQQGNCNREIVPKFVFFLIKRL